MKQKVTLIAILLMALAIPQSVKAYDFFAIAPTGQTLYYNIINGNAQVTSEHNGLLHYYSTYPTGALEIPSSVTYGGVTYLVTSISDHAFDGCDGLTSVTIPNSVTSIGEMSFSGCNGLTSVTIPEYVTSIDYGTFYYCTSLTSVTIPNSVSSIGYEAFYYCSSLTSVTIPNSVTSIDHYAFSCCSGLTSITVESGNTVYDSRGNCNAIIETSTNTLLTGCMNTAIPNSVTSIGDSAFIRCYGLTSMTIPNSVTSIGSLAFYGCIGLTSVTIGNSVTCIADWAFAECRYLTEITSLASEAPMLGSLVFKEVTNNIPVYIPHGSIALYQWEWDYFNNFIESGLGVTDVDDNEITIYSTEGRIVVRGAENIEMMVFDVTGREVVHSSRSMETLTLPSGVYLVKVGNYPARKVVVK